MVYTTGIEFLSYLLYYIFMSPEKKPYQPTLWEDQISDPTSPEPSPEIVSDTPTKKDNLRERLSSIRQDTGDPSENVALRPEISSETPKPDAFADKLHRLAEMAMEKQKRAMRDAEARAVDTDSPHYDIGYNRIPERNTTYKVVDLGRGRYRVAEIITINGNAQPRTAFIDIYLRAGDGDATYDRLIEGAERELKSGQSDRIKFANTENVFNPKPRKRRKKN